MTLPAKIAALIMIFAFGGFLACSIWGHEAVGMWSLVILALRHGFEGALVGGICDFIAVRQVYSKAHNNFPKLVDGVSKTVVLDMIRLSELLEKGLDIPNWLEEKENRDWLRNHLQLWLSEDRKKHHENLEKLWDEKIHYNLDMTILKQGIPEMGE